MISATKYGTKLEIPSGTTSNHYKQWKDKNNLLGTGYSTCYSRSSPLAGKNGTYHTPAPVTLTDFKFNIPSNVTIEKVIVHYKQKKEQLSSPLGQTAYPAINAPKITLLNTGGLNASGTAVPTNYTTYTKEFSGTAEFTNVTPSMINSNLFGVTIAYPKNANTNPGVVWLGDVHIEVVYEDKNIVLSIENNNFNITKNQEFTLNINCSYTGNEPITLKMPLNIDDLTYTGKQGGNGDVIRENNQLYWRLGINGTSSKQATIKLKSTTLGNKTISLTYNEDITATTTINVTERSIKITNDLQYVKRIVKNERVLYNVHCTNINDEWAISNEQITITFPDTVVINNMDILQLAYDATTSYLEGVMYLELHFTLRGGESIPINATFTDTGYYTQEVYYNEGLNYISQDYTVHEDSLGDLAFEFIKIPATVTERMNHNVTYVLSCFTRWSTGSDGVYITDYKDNLRIGVFNADGSYVLNDEDFLNHVDWSESLPTHDFKQVKVEFKYKDHNPLYFVVSHCYSKETNAHYVGLEYSEPVLIEKQYFNFVTDNKPILNKPKEVLTGGDYANGVLPPSLSFASLLCYDFSLGGLERLTHGEVTDKNDLLIQGIEVLLDYTSNELVKLEAELYIPNVASSTRNMSIKGSGTVILGKKYDTWGVKLGDLQQNISMLGVILRITNNETSNANVEINNLRINIYYIPRPYTGQYGFICDGERSQDYGIYLENAELPFGAKFDKEEYHINGTDENTVNRANLDSKEIKLEIGIDDCEESDIVYLIDKLETLLTNKRDLQTNEPILKSIAFDIMPNWKYRFVRVKEFDGEFTKGNYNAKITLYVPSGTRESINKTITGSTGTTGSYIPVKPVIYSKANTDGQFTLKEVKNNFILSIKNTNIKKGDTIIIDNNDRTVKLMKNGSNTQTRLYDGINLETTWFIIQDEYKFTSPNADVYQVEYYEKR